jgi:hypothetical protein
MATGGDSPDDARMGMTMVEDAEVVRQQGFDVEGPLRLDLLIGSGRVEVRLTEEPGAFVEVRHHPMAHGPWAQGISGLLSWFSGEFGSGEEGDMITEAVRETTLDLTDDRLTVRTPKSLPLRHVPLALTVRAPVGSTVEVRSGSAEVFVYGAAGKLMVSTGSGDVHAERADGPAQVITGSGAVRLGPMLAGLHARTGSGEVEVSSVGGVTNLVTGTGDVWLGAVAADVTARTGSGDLTIADAASGQVELATGYGEIRVGVRHGTAAEIDLRSDSGQARSELPLSSVRPTTEPKLRVRGRTLSGTAVATKAVD